LAVKICLDAGHYGKYNQSPVVKEYYESDFTWKLQELLASALEGYRFEVLKTRQEQAKDLSLNARGKAAKGCDLFLSIHSNACSSESVDRPVVIVQLDGRGDSLGKKLGECIQEVMQTRGEYQLYHKKGNSGGEYYGVLRGAAQVRTMGMILEHSFHTNTRAANWLMEEENLKRLANAEAKILADYFGLDTSHQEEQVVKVDPAKQFTKNLAGTYIVSSSDGFLNLRAGASTDKPILEAMRTGTQVRCYGYHTGNWLYVVSATGKQGFCSKAYLVKK